MPHGAPDWYKYRRDSATHPIDDLAELAARLDSISIFDRRGDIASLEGFQHGCQPWKWTPSGTGADAKLSPVAFLSYGYSLAITCPRDEQFGISVHCYLPYDPHGSIGLEAAFTLATHITTFKFALSVYDGQNHALTYLFYTIATQRLQYVDATGALINLEPTLDLNRVLLIFNHIKLVVDPTIPVYVRALLNHQAFPMTDIPTFSTPDNSVPNIHISMEWVGTVNQNPIVYLDNVIVTHDEP